MSRFGTLELLHKEMANLSNEQKRHCREYENSDVAYEVAYALCKAEHDRLGLPTGDERIIYPAHPDKMQPFVALGNVPKSA